MTEYTATERNIAIGTFLGAYALLLVIIRPFDLAKTMVSRAFTAVAAAAAAAIIDPRWVAGQPVCRLVRRS